MIMGLVPCLAYYIYSCWFSLNMLLVSGTLWEALLFGSGFIGIQVSAMLLVPVISKDAKKALGFLLGINGPISALGWISVGANYLTLGFLVFGFAQFFYFACYQFQAPQEAAE